jgi:hypothetical protein
MNNDGIQWNRLMARSPAKSPLVLLALGLWILGGPLMKKCAGWGWTPTDFTKKEATKKALLQIHSPYILHLATHGFFAKEDPNSAQSKSETLLDVRQGVTKSKFFKNPMHRSGLALAGAQTTIEAWK